MGNWRLCTTSAYDGRKDLVSGGKTDAVAVYHLGKKKLTTAAATAVPNPARIISFLQRMRVLMINNILS
jgi:ApbE superfamily uncharacterized protein (UPF0280 family)